MDNDHAPVALPDPAAPSEDEAGGLTRTGLFKLPRAPPARPG